MTSSLPVTRQPAQVEAFVTLAETLVDDCDVIDLPQHRGDSWAPGDG